MRNRLDKWGATTRGYVRKWIATGGLQYTPLDSQQNQIRLLVLEDPGGSDTIRASFRIQSLDDDDLRYKALSYVWGKEIHKKPILVHGMRVKVTKNLYNALKQMAQSEHTRILWVDALCIDQANDRDKHEQVTRMGQVYGRASQVVIWLGETYPGCDLALDWFQQLASNKDLHVGPSHEPHARTAAGHIFTFSVHKAVCRFFRSEWWTRVWTVQEFVLARTTMFYCGSLQLDGKMLQTAYRSFFRHNRSCHCIPDASDVDAVTLYKCIHVFFRLDDARRRMNKRTLPYLLTTFRARSSTDPRDKIFGMLGLAAGAYKGAVVPRYNISTEEAYEESTLAIITQTGKLDILSHVTKSSSLALPTFVPDWTDRAGADTDPYFPDWLNWLYRLDFHDASKGTSAQISQSGRGHVSISGTLIDVIGVKGPVFRSVPDMWFLGACKTMAQMSDEADTIYEATGETTIEAFWRTVTGNIEYFQNSSGLLCHRLRSSAFDLSPFEDWATWLPSLDYSTVTTAMRHIDRAFRDVASNRRFIVTTSKRFGFGPSHCEVGDVVAVLTGGKVPFVLRPTGTGSYTLVGDAYIHGLMRGEGMREEDLRDIRLV